MCDSSHDSRVLERTAVILENGQASEHLFFLELECADIAAALKPGQFVHMHIPGMEGHILRRPFSVLDVDESASRLTILYQVVGFGSAHLSTLGPGEEVSLLGPLGNTWAAPEGITRALLVAGGVGAAPLYLHAQQLIQAGVQVDVVLGAQTSSALVLRKHYTNLLGHEPVCSTDDGTYGHHGFATQPVQELLAQHTYDYAACCGPEPLMALVAGMTKEAGVRTQVSMEKRMACGIGACLSCVVETASGKRRSCVDGPIFEADEVVWS